MNNTIIAASIIGFIFGVFLEYLIIRGICAGHLHINMRTDSLNNRYLFEFNRPIETIATKKRVYFETDFNFPSDVSQKIQ